jgi:hypothetical protein
MSCIRYFVPEDGDVEDHPNIFLLPKSQHSGFSPKLREIKENFPMPGAYHFRFKSPLIPGSDREKNAVSVWMDCVNDDQHVGVWRNTIVAKVTRISMGNDDFEYGHTTAAQPAAVAPQRTSVKQNTAPQRRPQPAPTSAPQRVTQTPPVAPSDNLLGLEDNNNSNHSRPPPAPASNGSLLDMDNHHAAPSSGEGSLLDMHAAPASYNSNVQASNSHDDFLGMTSTPVSTTPAPANPNAQPQRSGSASAPVPPVPSPSSYGMPRPASNGNGIKPNNKAFETFANKSGPFGGLNW